MPAEPGTDVGVTAVDLDVVHQTTWRSMVRLAFLLTDDVASAEDVVQDAFRALHRQAASLRDVETAHERLRVAVVEGAGRGRRGPRRPLRSVRSDPAEPAAGDRHQRERDAAVLTALAGLPRRQREVLVLAHWEHLSEAAIARTLGIAADRVRETADRGLAALTDALRAAPTKGEQ